MVQVDILVLFLTLGGKLSVFQSCIFLSRKFVTCYKIWKIFPLSIPYLSAVPSPLMDVALIAIFIYDHAPISIVTLLLSMQMPICCTHWSAPYFMCCFSSISAYQYMWSFFVVFHCFLMLYGCAIPLIIDGYANDFLSLAIMNSLAVCHFAHR